MSTCCAQPNDAARRARGRGPAVYPPHVPTAPTVKREIPLVVGRVGGGRRRLRWRRLVRPVAIIIYILQRRARARACVKAVFTRIDTAGQTRHARSHRWWTETRDDSDQRFGLHPFFIRLSPLPCNRHDPGHGRPAKFVWFFSIRIFDCCLYTHTHTHTRVDL